MGRVAHHAPLLLTLWTTGAVAEEEEAEEEEEEENESPKDPNPNCGVCKRNILFVPGCY